MSKMDLSWLLRVQELQVVNLKHLSDAADWFVCGEDAGCSDSFICRFDEKVYKMRSYDWDIRDLLLMYEGRMLIG